MSQYSISQEYCNLVEEARLICKNEKNVLFIAQIGRSAKEILSKLKSVKSGIISKIFIDET